MSDFTLDRVDRFPNTTEVEAHAVSDWPGGIVRTDAAPLGTAADTQTMTDSTLTFTDLTQSERYVAYAEVGGEHVYVGFVAGEDISQAASLVHQEEIDPLLAAKRGLVVNGGGRITTAAVVATDYVAARAGSDTTLAGATVIGASSMAKKYLELADYAAPDGYELWGRSRLVFCVGNAPAITYTLGLYPITNPAGTLTKGTLVPGSEHVVASPAANGIRMSEQEFSLEGLADGLYAPTYRVSGTPGNNLTFEYELEWFWQAAA